jgi:hypothetical protein
VAGPEGKDPWPILDVPDLRVLELIMSNDPHDSMAQTPKVQKGKTKARVTLWQYMQKVSFVLDLSSQQILPCPRGYQTKPFSWLTGHLDSSLPHLEQPPNGD